MCIGNLRMAKADDKARVMADITWEDRAREPREFFYERTRESADDLVCSNSYAFPVGCMVFTIRRSNICVSRI